MYLDDDKLPCIGENILSYYFDWGITKEMSLGELVDQCCVCLCLSACRGGGGGSWRIMEPETVHHLYQPKDMEGQ